MTSGPTTFLSLWPAAIAAAGVEESSGVVRAATSTLFVLNLGGFEIPALTAFFAVLGVVLARPLSPKGAVRLSAAKNVLVTIILCLLALCWVIDSRPGLLFSFVVSIGLGFAGFSIIELAGTEVLAFLKRLAAAVSGSKPNG